MKEEVVIVEEIINAPVAKVWNILTDNKEMKNWYFDIEEFKTDEGFEFKLSGEKDNKKYPTSCKILQAKPYQALSYTWSFDEVPFDTVVTFELFPHEQDKTKLRLTHEGIPNIPSGEDAYSLENFKQGWTEIIGSSLKKYAEQKA